MAMVNVRAMALKQFENPKLNEIYAYYRESDGKLTLVERKDRDSRYIPSDEKLGIEFVDRIHVPIPDNLSEYLAPIERVIENVQAEIQDAQDADWQRIKDIVD